MHDKLRLLLEKINLSEEYYSSFDDGKLEKLKISKNKNEWIFIVLLKETIDVKLYDEINKLLKKRFKELDKVSITFKYEKVIEEKLVEYFVYFLDKYKKSYASIKDNKVYIKDDSIYIEVTNEIEKNKIIDIKNDLILNFKNAGYDYGVETKYNEEDRVIIKNEIKKEIVERIKVETKKDNTTIFGVETKKKRIVLSKMLYQKKMILLLKLIFLE